jgi:hypothetical protein
MAAGDMLNDMRLELSGHEPDSQSDWVTGLHPMDVLLRGERLPHIWCQGCGLGTALTTFIGALQWMERLRSPGFLSHHPWTGHSVCHGS